MKRERERERERERDRERVLLKFRVVRGYEILSLEQTRHTRRDDENKQRNQIEISQFRDFSYQTGR